MKKNRFLTAATKVEARRATALKFANHVWCAPLAYLAIAIVTLFANVSTVDAQRYSYYQGADARDQMAAQARMQPRNQQQLQQQYRSQTQMQRRPNVQQPFPRSQRAGTGMLPPQTPSYQPRSMQRMRNASSFLRFNKQELDDDPFGEGATDGSSSPFTPAPNRRQDEQDNPFGEPQPDPNQDTNQLPDNPFGEQLPRRDRPQPDTSQRTLQGVDPSANTPPMDTQTIPPRLPGDGQFTPDPEKIPGLPTPDGGTQREPDKIRYPDGAVLPGDEEKPDRSTDGREPTPANPDQRGTTEPRDGLREPVSSSVQRYLPAPNPTYYSRPVDPRGVPGGYAGGRMNPNAYQNPNTAGMAPYGYAANALPGPYGYTGMMNPNAAMAQGYKNPAMANMASASGMCSPGCMPVQACPPCNAAAIAQSNPVYTPSMQLPAPPASTYVGSAAPSNFGPGYAPPSFAPQTGCQQSSCPQPMVASNCCPDPCGGTGSNVYSSIVDPCATCYFSFFGGSSDLMSLVATEDRNAGTYFDDAGYGIGGAIGQIQGRNLRLELEVSYRAQDVSGLNLLDSDGTTEYLDLTGDFSTLAGMANARWEFVDFPGGQFKPYVGAGVGFVTAFPDFSINGTAVMTNDHESSLAYQWMAGVNYKLEPQTDLFVEYRYFRADSLSLNTNIVPATTAGNGSGRIDHVVENIFFGIRMRF